MTVGELIALLAEYDPESRVLSEDHGHGGLEWYAKPEVWNCRGVVVITVCGELGAEEFLPPKSEPSYLSPTGQEAG